MKFHFSQGLDQKRWYRRIGIALGILIFLGLIGYIGVQRWYQHNLAPVSQAQMEVLFGIEPGTSTADIASQLQSAGIIRDSRAFLWYLRQQGNPPMQAGSYRLDSSMSSQEVAEILITGRVDTSLVTIPPGLRLDQIRDRLIEQGFSAADIDAALAKSYDHPLLRFKKSGDSLEGYIYPETLQITEDTTVEDILKRSFDLFYEKLTPTVLDAIGKQELNLHQAVILASIVQEEVSNYEEQRKVAQVFLKRLEIGMPLGADPTFRYAAAITGQEATPDLDNPYNTRIYDGLPPGPIANFNFDALRAVANPAETDYLYFVSGDDGITRFSKTFEEHEANIAKYCQELCQL